MRKYSFCIIPDSYNPCWPSELKVGIFLNSVKDTMPELADWILRIDKQLVELKLDPNALLCDISIEQDFKLTFREGLVTSKKYFDELLTIRSVPFPEIIDFIAPLKKIVKALQK